MLKLLNNAAVSERGWDSKSKKSKKKKKEEKEKEDEKIRIDQFP